MRVQGCTSTWPGRERYDQSLLLSRGKLRLEHFCATITNFIWSPEVPCLGLHVGGNESVPSLAGAVRSAFQRGWRWAVRGRGGAVALRFLKSGSNSSSKTLSCAVAHTTSVPFLKVSSLSVFGQLRKFLSTLSVWNRSSCLRGAAAKVFQGKKIFFFLWNKWKSYFSFFSRW